MEATATKVDQGQFLWYELMTSDAAAAKKFYGHVIGWTTEEYDFQGNDGPEYEMWAAGGVPVGGVMQIDPETMGPTLPHWACYIHSKDVDATIKKAKELGGSVHVEPMDIPTVGRMACLADPTGAAFWIMKPATNEPMPDAPQHGSFTWKEVATTDYLAAFSFYNKLFGWEKVEEMDMGNGWMYLMFGKGESMVGGMYNLPPEVQAPPHWLMYINVPDLTASLEKVKELGGQVVNGPMEVPGGDHVATCIDPHGAVFALHESAA